MINPGNSTEKIVLSKFHINTLRNPGSTVRRPYNLVASVESAIWHNVKPTVYNLIMENIRFKVYLRYE